MRLSKSRFVAGVQCSKRLYFLVHHPDLATEPDEKAQSIMDQGTQVGIEAQKAFPGGVLVDASREELDKAIAVTREFVANPEIPAIFEATFEADRVLVRVDVLKRDVGGSFQILEVKSSTKLKDEYLYDIGIQKQVVTRSGLKVSKACLMHINRDYVYAGGDYDQSELFSILEITPEIAIDEAEIESRSKEQLRILAASEPPEVKPGSQCMDPVTCEFFDQCNQPVPAYHVSTLPRISAKALNQLAALNIETIHAVAEDFPLTETQKIVRNAVQAGELWVSPNLAAELGQLSYPLCFMDFETISPALPRFPGMHPYAYIPFQWSVHRMESPGAELQHFEFLANDGTDPRIPFIDSLLVAIEGADTIVVYNQGFEKPRLQEIADFMPKYAASIKEIHKRIWDLWPCVRKNVYHPAFGGSYSIKVVLPALVPDMSYKGMAVAEGEAAGIAFMKMTDPSTLADERASLREALLRYCGQDTLATVRVLELLLKFAGSRSNAAGAEI